MNTTLNINRIGLLLKRYFIENKQLELTFWIIATVVFMLFHKTSFAGLFLGVAGFIFAANSFKAFSITPNGIHYLLIPATHAEKLIATIVINTLYFFIMFLITYIIGTTLGTVIYNFILSVDNPINFNLFHESSSQLKLTKSTFFIGENYKLLKLFTLFACSQSIFMVGSIYFKRNAAIKTLLVFYGFIIALIVIEVLIVKATFGTYSLTKNMIGLSIKGEYLFSGFYVVAKIIPFLLIPFFWIVTYFRLTEKQV